jgi:hypothetical protein
MRATMLAQRLERPPDLSREHLRLFPGGEVPALVGLVEVGEGGVCLLSPAARGPEDLARKLVKPTGTLTGGRGCPAARAAARVPSQYERAAEAPVPVSQYSVMLSRMWSRVRHVDSEGTDLSFAGHGFPPPWIG